MEYLKNDVCVRIIGKSKIDFEEIEKLPFDFIKKKKGDILRGIITVENDVALLKIDLHGKELYEQIEELLKKLHPYKDYIKKISAKYDVMLRIYVESIMAQMYFCLPAELIKKIADFSMELEVSVFSEGMVAT